MVFGGFRDDRNHAFRGNFYFDPRGGRQYALDVFGAGARELRGVYRDRAGAFAVVLQAESGFHLFMAGFPFRGESPVDGFFFLYRVAVGGGFVPLVFGGGRVAVGFFDAVGIPFPVTVFVTIAFVWIYTVRGGIKTIVWTDALQTVCILVSVGLTIAVVMEALDFNFSSAVAAVKESPLSHGCSILVAFRAKHGETVSGGDRYHGLPERAGSEYDAEKPDLPFTSGLQDEYVYFFVFLSGDQCAVPYAGGFVVYICRTGRNRVAREVG